MSVCLNELDPDRFAALPCLPAYQPTCLFLSVFVCLYEKDPGRFAAILCHACLHAYQLPLSGSTYILAPIPICACLFACEWSVHKNICLSVFLCLSDSEVCLWVIELFMSAFVCLSACLSVFSSASSTLLLLRKTF